MRGIRTGDGRLTSFAKIEVAAAKRKGGAKALGSLVPKPRSRAALAKTPDDVFLSAMAKQIFRAGFVWKIVEYKWPAIEEGFSGFDVETVAGYDEAEIDMVAEDPRVIRHRAKITAIRDDARWILRIAEDHGSFGKFLADWPDTDIVGLWAELAKKGKRLGGMTGPIFLREVGKDTFLLSPDVVKALRREKVIAKAPTSKADLAKVQAAFTAWRKETGRPLCQLSRILSASVP